MHANQPTSSNRWRALLGSAVLIFFGIAIGLGAILLLLRAFPQFVPGGTRFIFTDYDGDTFRHQPGQVRPPEQNRVLEDVLRFDDADGFRQPAQPAAMYPIAAIGDSFTDGGQTPWTDVLAEALGEPVRNLGWSGFGPLEYAEIARRFIGPEQKWVLVMYFEGNDLSNSMTTRQTAEANEGVVPLDLSRATAAPKIDVKQLSDYSEIVIDPQDRYLYPLTHTLADGSQVELAYISDYIWWLNGTPDAYRDSRNMAEVRKSLTEIQHAAGDACVALVYAPIKGHIYLQYADPDGNRRYVLENARQLRLDAPGEWLDFDPVTPMDWETLASRMDNQRDVVQSLTESLGIRFIDLIPAFEQAALSGEATYFTYDSHWSPRGHQVAGETVAESLRAQPTCGN
jgi:hypothetical protein